jgi:hypothetical protein
MKTTYLDSNTVSDLVLLRPRASQLDAIQDVRRDLCSASSPRTIVLGQWLFSELSFLENGDRRANFLAHMEFLQSLAFIQIVHPPGDMKRLEVEAFLRRDELDPVRATKLPSVNHDTELWAGEREHANEMKTEYLKWEDEADQRLARDEAAGVDAVPPPLRARKAVLTPAEARAQALTEEWTADREGIVSSVARDQMRKQRESLGLPLDENLWPHPQVLPTFWCDWAYRVTRDLTRAMSPVLKKRKGSERKGSHAIDWGHYMSAAHADEFVTSDEDFLEIIRAAPGPKPEILNLAEWVARLRAE